PLRVASASCTRVEKALFRSGSGVGAVGSGGSDAASKVAMAPRTNARAALGIRARAARRPAIYSACAWPENTKPARPRWTGGRGKTSAAQNRTGGGGTNVLAPRRARNEEVARRVPVVALRDARAIFRGNLRVFTQSVFRQGTRFRPIRLSDL